MFTYIHSAQKEGWWLVSKAIIIYTSFFSIQQEHNSIVLPNNQIAVTTYTHLIDTDKGGIKTQKEDYTELKSNTPLIKDLEM